MPMKSRKYRYNFLNLLRYKEAFLLEDHLVVDYLELVAKELEDSLGRHKVAGLLLLQVEDCLGLLAHQLLHKEDNFLEVVIHSQQQEVDYLELRPQVLHQNFKLHLPLEEHQLVPFNKVKVNFLAVLQRLKPRIHIFQVELVEQLLVPPQATDFSVVQLILNPRTLPKRA